jgi:hypothetical protein
MAGGGVGVGMEEVAVKHRTYRLRDLLRHMRACKAWRDFVVGFVTADEVLAAVNADPSRQLDPGSTIGDNVRWFAGEIARDLFDSAAMNLWGYARRYTWDRRAVSTPPITREERDRFVKLWIAYADKHGLYTEESR